MVMLSLLVLLAGLPACSGVGKEYFIRDINEVTTDDVSKRYGAPHKIEELEWDQARWTYFKRSSVTVGYAGIGRGEACTAYLLTFDRHNVLRDWQQMSC